MSFFTCNSKTLVPISEADRIILCAGQIAEEAMLASFVESAAYWASYDRKRTKDLDRQYPGYRKELNKRRAAVGLSAL